MIEYVYKIPGSVPLSQSASLLFWTETHHPYTFDGNLLEWILSNPVDKPTNQPTNQHTYASEDITSSLELDIRRVIVIRLVEHLAQIFTFKYSQFTYLCHLQLCNIG